MAVLSCSPFPFSSLPLKRSITSNHRLSPSVPMVTMGWRTWPPLRYLLAAARVRWLAPRIIRNTGCHQRRTSYFATCILFTMTGLSKMDVPAWCLFSTPQSTRPGLAATWETRGGKGGTKFGATTISSQANVLGPRMCYLAGPSDLQPTPLKMMELF